MSALPTSADVRAAELEVLERALCGELGHRWHHETRGEPVTSFSWCRCCGLFARGVVP